MNDSHDIRKADTFTRIIGLSVLLITIMVFGFGLYQQYKINKINLSNEKIQSQNVPMIEGNFITLRKPGLSLYITRSPMFAKDGTMKPTVCFVQSGVNGNPFENCIWQETMDSIMNENDGIITISNRYKKEN